MQEHAFQLQISKYYMKYMYMHVPFVRTQDLMEHATMQTSNGTVCIKSVILVI